MTSTEPWDAIVLAGGSSRRMGGTDKVMLGIGGSPLLHRVVAAAATADRVVVVGPERALPAAVTWCREEPPGGGPASAVATGLQHVRADITVLLAADLPFVEDPSLRSLRVATAHEHGAVVVDEAGEPQWLCSAWPTALLRTAALTPGASLRATLGVLPWTPVTLDGRQTLDCDTPEDVERARELAP